MATARTVNRDEPDAELRRWLWYGVAYLVIIVVLGLLARYVPTPTSSRLDSFD
jgi:hypothetical protein